MYEVEVPVLGSSGASDPQIESIAALVCRETRYLQSSPEYFLKRLLSETKMSCFCITKAFRNEEFGANHNPEFSMLEWYRVDFDLDEIIEESVELIRFCMGTQTPVATESYRSLFENFLGINPHLADLGQLQLLVTEHTSYQGCCESITEALQLLLTSCIEPKLSPGITILKDFPIAQAALAEIGEDQSGQLVAKRFEIYLDQIEIANGYQELTDYVEQKSRFDQDNQIRKSSGLAPMAQDELLLEAIKAGLPACSGVSIGLDRLLMIKQGLDRIDSVLLFPWERA